MLGKCEPLTRSAKFEQQVRRVVLLLVTVVLSANTTAEPAATGELRIAVATNFAPVLDEIAAEFTKATRIDVNLIMGSTGKLYAQIKNGMDIDLFLAADQTRIRRLVADGVTFEDTLTTYAEGRLVWWHPGSQPNFDSENTLQIGNEVGVVAFAQPDLAPYGNAAESALSKCFRFDRARIRFVHGENVGQTYAHVATGNADAGLVALASIRIANGVDEGSYAIVPRDCHEPIRQDAVVLKASRNAIAAHQFLDFLLDERTQRRIAEYGYTSL